MPIYSPTASDDFEQYGATFRSYVRPERGSTALCAWRLDVQPGAGGVPHVANEEEVILMLEGDMVIKLDDVEQTASSGDVVHVPAGTMLTATAGPKGASAWVTTIAGMSATIGTEVVTGPWAR
jgi:quercetin dioxygenase-like cupin family protein